MNARGLSSRCALRLVSLACVLTALGACATWKAPTDTSDAALRSRALTSSKRGVQVSAAVLGAEDSLRLLGTDVTAEQVQPVWIEVRNDTDHPLWLLRSGTDPDYFSTLEVAWSSHVTMGGETNERIDEHFDSVAFPNPIPQHAVRSGILFTNPQPVRKLVNVDLLGDKLMIPFTLILPVPGDIEAGVELIHRYSDTEITAHDDLDGLRHAIESLPCCATMADGTAGGEPLNVVLIGRLDDLAAAYCRRGFRRDASDAAPSQQVFGRTADFLVRKRAQAGASAVWLRIWRAPLSHRGQMVFVAQAGRPIGGRFRQEGSDLRLHPDVDEARNVMIHEFMYSGGLEKFGITRGVGAVPADQPKTVPGGGSFFTDGRRVAFFIGTRPLTFADVEILDWEPFVSASAADAAKNPRDANR